MSVVEIQQLTRLIRNIEQWNNTRHTTWSLSRRKVVTDGDVDVLGVCKVRDTTLLGATAGQRSRGVIPADTRACSANSAERNLIKANFFHACLSTGRGPRAGA